MSDYDKTTVLGRSIEEEMRESYLRYSMSVIISRALPDVRDGLKPSQRRILYAMKQLNLSPKSKHRKCAKICGDTSGDYHPHGELVIYPTLVRMAQPWVMRYNLIEGQGNFGSVDGDPPAQMRYTEARLTSAAIFLMQDLEKDTVDFVSNYDETRQEPTVLPSKFPNLICNGSSGIAVGMATNIPPHNLCEVISGTHLLLNDAETSVDELNKVIPGPDFPTGGIICGYRGIQQAYHTGRGKLSLRGLIRVEEASGKNDRDRLIIDELPYNVNKSNLIKSIAGLISHKTITGIADLRDESDKEGLRIVVDLKKGEMPEVILNQLYKYSDLEVTFGCNMLALHKGLPQTLNIKQMLVAWIDHRIEVIRRRIAFELDKAEKRAHILEGYLKAIDVLDQVVKLIRESKDKLSAKDGLMETWGFSEVQANAILDLRLYQLTGLEQDKVSQEYQEKLERIAYYRKVLADENMVKDIIREELSEIKEKHSQPRRTQIIAAESDMNMEDLIPNEPVIVSLSGDDYIKRMSIDLFKEQRRGGQGVMGMQLKDSDKIKSIFSANNHDYLLLFTNKGRCYWLKTWQVPDTGRRSKGKPIVNFLDGLREDEKVATVLNVSEFTENRYVLLCTKKGVIKKMPLTELKRPRRSGVWALTIDEGDDLLEAGIIELEQQVMMLTRSGNAIRFSHEDVRSMGRLARGVRGVKLRDNKDAVVACNVVSGDQSLLLVCENGYGKRSLVSEFRQTKRGGVGVKAIITNERNGDLVSAVRVMNEDSVILMSMLGQTVRIPMSDVRVMGRSTQGVRLANIKDADSIVAVEKIMQSASVDEDETDESDANTSKSEEQSILEQEPVNETLSSEYTNEQTPSEEE